MADIKPCPCCGAGAKHWFCTSDGKHSTDTPNKIVWGISASHHLIRCTKCGLQTKIYATAKGAFNSWNRRKQEVN